jgi:hypothetical protein
MLLKAKTILKLYQGVFYIFHEGFSLIIMSECVCIKVIGVCNAYCKLWEASMSFRWCVRCLQVEKIPIPLCFWKHRGVFSLLEWRVMLTVTRFIASDVIFSLLISKLVLAMQIFIVVFWFMGISSLVPNILISNLCFWLFCKFFICF